MNCLHALTCCWCSLFTFWIPHFLVAHVFNYSLVVPVLKLTIVYSAYILYSIYSNLPVMLMDSLFCPVLQR